MTDKPKQMTKGLCDFCGTNGVPVIRKPNMDTSTSAPTVAICVKCVAQASEVSGLTVKGLVTCQKCQYSKVVRAHYTNNAIAEFIHSGVDEKNEPHYGMQATEGKWSRTGKVTHFTCGKCSAKIPTHIARNNESLTKRLYLADK